VRAQLLQLAPPSSSTHLILPMRACLPVLLIGSLPFIRTTCARTCDPGLRIAAFQLHKGPLLKCEGRILWSMFSLR